MLTPPLKNLEGLFWTVLVQLDKVCPVCQALLGQGCVHAFLRHKTKVPTEDLFPVRILFATIWKLESLSNLPSPDPCMRIEIDKKHRSRTCQDCFWLLAVPFHIAETGLVLSALETLHDMFIFITCTSPSGSRNQRCLRWNEWDDFSRCRCNARGVGWYLENMKKSSRHFTRARPKRHWHWLAPRILKSYWRPVMSTRVVCPRRVCLPQEDRQLVNVSPGTGSPWVPSATCTKPGGPFRTTCVSSQSTEMPGVCFLEALPQVVGFTFVRKLPCKALWPNENFLVSQELSFSFWNESLANS